VKHIRFRAKFEEGQDTQPKTGSTNSLIQEARKQYWDKRFSISTLIIALLALLAGYLQYSVYPAIMTNQFGETNISLHLFFFTYTLDAQKCVSANSCPVVAGLPSFDFAQLLVAILILMQVYHFVKVRKY
jgi:hypothetical protein